jgi:hypothetical protein
MMDAVHDSAVCVGCGRLGGPGGNRAAATLLFLKAASSWLERAHGSFGRDSRGVANILQAAAKLAVDTREPALQSLLRETCSMSSGFNAQNAANSLWAAATLGLRDDAVIEPLAGACVSLSRSFNAQDAANSLWAAAVLDIRDEAFCRAAAAPLRGAASSSEDAQQLLYVDAASRAWLPSPPLFSSSELDAFRSRAGLGSSTSSRSQHAVAASLARLGFAAEEEARVLDGLHAVDALVRLPSGARVAVEFDGPSHFLRFLEPAAARRAPEPNGATRLRDRLLRASGLTVVAIPYFEWDPLRSDAVRDAYVAARLARAATAPVPVA